MRPALDLILRRGRAVGRPEILRAGFGALFGLALCGFAARMIVEGRFAAEPLLIAPIGASAVLVFGIPASPLARPWSVIGGNTVAALVGVACALWIPTTLVAAPMAVAAAVLAMVLLGCLHPPGGAVALAAVLARASGSALGFDYALAPVGLCSVLLVAAAAVYGRLSGHPYPHRVARPVSAHNTQDPPPAERLGYRRADLDEALARYGELLDVSREDLDALFRQVELQAQKRIHTQVRCEDIMSRHVISLDLQQSSESALAYLQRHDLRTAPVVDSEGRVVGMARRAELLAAKGRAVQSALDPFVHKVRPSTPIEALLPLLSSGAAHEAMVIDEDRKLIGVITQTDLLAVLYRAYVVEAVTAAKAA